MARLRLFLSGVIGLGGFVLPIPVDGRWTVAFDVLVKSVRGAAPEWVSGWCLGLVALGAVASLLRRGALFQAGLFLTASRVLGLGIAILVVFDLGPGWLTAPEVGGFLWGKLVTAVGVIVPVGVAALSVLAGYGLLELVGTWMRPVMRPLFRLPGRAALDDLMSWLGSYSVGLYLTHQLTEEGRYTRREAFLIVTGFSTVSVGFVGVVASTLDLLHLFPLIFATYFVVVYGLAMLQARVWPATAIPDETLGPSIPEVPVEGPIWAASWRLALERAEQAPPMWTLAGRGLVDGTLLAASILGTILAVGTAATCVAEYTPVFDVLGAPLVPILVALGLPDASLVAPAVLAGITEMYVPALMVKEASEPARFFVCVLSISQLIFFSSVAPMMLDLFRKLPVRVGHLVFLFALRTAVLVPVLAAWTAVLQRWGVLSS